MKTPFVIQDLPNGISFSLAGTPDMFREGDTFMMDWGVTSIADAPTEMRVVEATYEESRVMTETFDVYPGMWTVRAVPVGGED